MKLGRAIALLAIPFVAVGVHAQTPTIVAHAQRLVEKQPTFERRVGLAELERAHGLKQTGVEELEKLAKSLDAKDPRAAELQEFLCWRMLPVTPAQREGLRRHVATLKSLQPGNPWVPVLELYLLGGESDRNAFLAAARALPAKTPERFPAAFGETAHRKLLQELGHTQVQAGVEVISGRSFDALHALRELDRAIGREAEFLRSARRDDDAAFLLHVGDRHRIGYEKASRHLVERLFALHLRQAVKERDALLVKAKALPFLHDRARLTTLLERMDNDQAWKLLIEPLLTSELTLIDNPPDIAKLQAQAIAQVRITSARKAKQGDTVQYDGDVRLRLNALEVDCTQLTVVNNANPALVVMTGAGPVRVKGFAAYPGGVTADRFTYQAETGAFALGGDVRLVTLDKTIKLRSCTLTQRGELRDPRSLIDDFRGKFVLGAKFDMLPAITKIYDDDELPDDVRYLLALNLLRKHLNWHAPYLPPLPDRNELRDLQKQIQREYYYQSAWQEALGGDKWMHDEIGPEVEEAFRASVRAWYKAFNDNPRNKGATLIEFPIPGKDMCFWRLPRPDHPDVARAKRLLRGISADELAGKALRWRDELERNNTVITFDIAGAAPVGRAHSLLMDVRNAERVSFKLYRVQRPEELLYATKKIGIDFIYADHGLDHEGQKLAAVEKSSYNDVKSRSSSRGEYKQSNFTPAWTPEQLVRKWDVAVADLHTSRGYHRERRHWRHWDREDWYEEIDAHYFGDECLEHQARISKDYRPDRDDRFSSWQCDRIVTIPEKVLSEAGAYVLIAEANGQTAHVPIVVEPISLTLRRCRDGVFVQASDAEMKKPLAGAKVYALDLDGSAMTDKEGVAFARSLALGDRAIVVHHEGRYAIGGFGRVFEGLYEHHDDEPHELMEAMKRLERGRRGDAKDVSARVYADRHVILAYTDRPTYRPGQDVHFKLIVRKFLEDASTAPATTFRGDDFDRPLKFALPRLDETLRYAVIDPKGREVETGTLNLSDFGSAAGKVTLNSESVLGSYSLRVTIAGQPRIVPDVFALKHYRRPNFEVDVAGVPAKLAAPRTLTLDVSSHYYFGPPVARGTLNVRLLHANGGRQLVKEVKPLSAKGDARIELQMPNTLDSGRYLVVCSVNDESGRTVSTTRPLVLARPEAPAGGLGLTALPRFVAIDHEFTITTTAKEVLAEQEITSLKFAVKDGSARLKLPAPGWYTLKAGDQETEIFVYGGKEHPRFYAPERERGERRDRIKFAEGEDDPHLHKPNWVNLSDYNVQEDGRLSRWERPSQHLYALFDKQSVTLGDKLRLLVYVPHKNAKLLFTMEGRTILDYAVVQVPASNGAYHIVELPMKERHVPNFYLQGRILRFDREPAPDGGKRGEAKAMQKALDKLEDAEEDFDSRWCRVDVARPAGKAEASALDVKIETDQPKYLPGDTVRATVKVTDREGRPQAAELSLAAIDESVYYFGEDNLDSLPAFFHRPQEARRFLPKVWRVSIGERWSKHAADAKRADSLLKDMQKAQESAMKGGLDSLQHLQDSVRDREPNFTAVPLSRLGGQLPSGTIPVARLREHFHETAAWLPQLRTDATGVVHASFKLPDSLTRYRLTSVALTKGTDIGVGRARITAALPLAVQVFVPRFAIEKDQLSAVAVIHNGADRVRGCQFKWEIDGATAEGPLNGRVNVPANDSIKVTLPLKMDRIGDAKIVVTVLDGKDGDKEARTLPVHALGREKDIGVNKALPAAQPNQPGVKEVFGKFNKQGKIELPKGFVAREIHLSLAVSELAQALDGLDYLVDYPHGCIEQTMSRFLPVVMIKHATQNSPVALQPDIAAKLPDILDKGLTRVYGYQHADGSWGWFDKDSQNFPMSVYVVYGLARCKASGVKVDADVLRRGCEYLLTEVRANKQPSSLTARAWYAIALAGEADGNELEKWARAELARLPEPVTACNLALACKTQGLAELGERLWAKAKGWHAYSTEELALKLNTQIAFGAPYRDCHDTAYRILGHRSGTHWYHTRDTSWAIESLSGMLGYMPEKNLVRKVEVSIGGKKVLEGRQAGTGKEMIYRLHLKGDQLPNEEALRIDMNVDADEPIQVAFRAAGVQRLDDLKATGTNVRLQRVIESLDGAPLKGPLRIGQVVRVRLKLDLAHSAEYLLVEERRASLCEFADEHLGGTAAQAIVHREFRDDRLCLFFRALPAGSHEIIYYVRAETAGVCSVLPGCAYPMYDENTRGETGGSKIEVK